jgi:uncharacterized protein (TIGR02466 family)
MAHIETWFPTAIYIQKNLFPKYINDNWCEHILKIKETTPTGGEDWEGKTYTTHTKYDLKQDPIFNELIMQVTDHVKEFASAHNSSSNYTCQHAWANVAEEGNFQEYHTHDGSVFSAVYYPRVPNGSGNILFEDPKLPDMLPISNISERNDLSYFKIGYEPEEGMLLIFRSYLRHAVRAGTNKEPRISFALNFGPNGV